MRRSKTAKALLSYSKKEVSVTISEDAAQYLAEEAEGGIFEFEQTECLSRHSVFYCIEKNNFYSDHK